MPEPFALTLPLLKEIVVDAGELAKGAQILDAGGLLNLSRYENRLFAEAKGSGAAPYKVQLTFGEKPPEVKARCSCMAARSRPYCKHACALLTAWLKSPKGFVTSEGPPAGAPGDAKKKAVKKGKAETQDLLRKGVEQAGMFVRELAATGVASIASGRLDQIRTLAEQLRANRLRRLSAKTLELADCLDKDGEVNAREFMDLVSDVLLTVRKLEKHLAGEPLEDKHVEELIGKTWTKKDRQPIAGLDLIGYAHSHNETADNFIVRENLFVDAATGVHYSQKQILPAFLAKRTPAIADFTGRRLKDVQGSTYPGYAPVRLDLENNPAAEPLGHDLLAASLQRALPGAQAALAAFQEHRKDVFAPDSACVMIAGDAILAQGDLRHLLDSQGGAIMLRPSTTLDFELLEALEGVNLRAVLGRIEHRRSRCELTPLACIVERKGQLALKPIRAGFRGVPSGTGEQSSLAEVRSGLADAFVAGLASLTPRVVEPMALRLKDLGLEKPGALLLAAAQKPDAAEKLDDVVKIYSVLGIAELRMSGASEFARSDMAEVPTHPSVLVKKPQRWHDLGQLAGERVRGSMNEFEAALHAARFFADQPIERLLVEIWPIWADASLSPYLIHKLEELGEKAIPAAQDALSGRYGNTAALTAVRLLQRIGGRAKDVLASAAQLKLTRKADSAAPQYPGEIVANGSVIAFAAFEALEALDPGHVLLGKLRDARTQLDELLLKAADPQKDVREKAVLDLGGLGIRGAITTLRRISEDDKVADVREAATRALGHLCDGKLVERWLLALDRANATDRKRRAAAEALGASGDARAALALVGILELGDAPDLVGIAAERLPACAAPLFLDAFERKPELAKRQANVSLMQRLKFDVISPLLTRRLESARAMPEYAARAALYLKLAGEFETFDKSIARVILADAAKLTDKDGKAVVRSAQRVLEPPKKKPQ
ncbi:MAG: HEAT repeat domain-containing protein [Planctomycetes bacterium]|nr:HEAT repeat domain-containing protein [Planctomycetota bacterium]